MELVMSERVLFHGDVQGVGFRWTLSRLAREQGLAGWVCNQPDGTVEAVLQGGREPINLVLKRIMLVSDRIRITRVEQSKVDLPPISGFSVQ